ncbi:MAG: right-handed parallel beta-helix repeat-containing protein [archaeon]
MNKLTASALVLIFSVIFVSVSNIGVVKAEGVIFIRADGSVEGTDKIQRDGDVYTFLDNIVVNGLGFDGIIVEKDNIVINGKGYVLQGQQDRTGHGIDLSNRKNVTVKNCEIQQFHVGIYINGGYYGPRNSTFYENSIINNDYGFLLNSSSHNTIGYNYVKSNGYGIYLESSHNNTISENKVTNNDRGISIVLSHFSVLKNNMMFDNEQNLIVNGFDPSDLTQYIDTSNTVNGKPVYYWLNKQNKTVPSDAGYVALKSCKNIVVQNLNLTNNGQGILLASTTDSTIVNNTLTKNENGIWFHGSSNNTLLDNSIRNNCWGVRIQGSYPTYAPNNKVCGNLIANNNEYGIIIIDSVDNKIYANNITNNGYGVYIDSTMELTKNIIYQNNFINNTEHAAVPGWWHTIVFEEQWVPPASNIWDNNRTGNYWTNYNGTDVDADGVGDAPYVIDENNQDSYPLMTQVDLTEIPEFPTWTILPILSAITLVALIGNQKLKQNPRKEEV